MSEYMIFCLGNENDAQKDIGYQKNYQIFNQQVDKEEWDKIKKSLPDIKLPLNVWINKKDMTDDEKENSSVWKEIGGFLRTLSYKDAWKKWWSEAKQSDKNSITGLKYFDAKIFEGITGITNTKSKSLSGKVVKVEIDGKNYEATIK